MAAKRTTLATIWELPDPLWREIEPLLLEDTPPKATGRPRADLRRVYRHRGTAELIDERAVATLGVVHQVGGIARGSAMECSALLDVCRIQRGYDEDKIKTGKALLLRIVEMLTKMCR